MPTILEFLLEQGMSEKEARRTAERLGYAEDANMEDPEVEEEVQDTIQVWVNQYVGIACNRCDRPISRKEVDRALRAYGGERDDYVSWLCGACHHDDAGAAATPRGSGDPLALPMSRS